MAQTVKRLHTNTHTGHKHPHTSHTLHYLYTASMPHTLHIHTYRHTTCITQPDTQNTHTWHILSTHATHVLHTQHASYTRTPHTHYHSPTTYHTHPIQTHMLYTNTHTYHIPHTDLYTHTSHVPHTAYLYTLHTPYAHHTPIQTHVPLYHTHTPCTNTYKLHTPPPHTTYTHSTHTHAHVRCSVTWCSGPGPTCSLSAQTCFLPALSFLSLGFSFQVPWLEAPVSTCQDQLHRHAPCHA